MSGRKGRNDTLSCGIRFHKNKDGELLYIPWLTLLDEYYKSKIGRRREIERRAQWVAGDIALYIETMVRAAKWPHARFEEFVERLQYKDPNQVRN